MFDFRVFESTVRQSVLINKISISPISTPGWAKIKRELITSKNHNKEKEKETNNNNNNNNNNRDHQEGAPNPQEIMRSVSSLQGRSPQPSKRSSDIIEYNNNNNNYYSNNNNNNNINNNNNTNGILSQNNNYLNKNHLILGEKKRCVRLLVLGQDGVGKSAFVVRYLTRRYIGEYDPLIEDVFRKTILLDNEDINLEIKDTSRGISWSRRANDLIWTNGLICLYSINNRSSFTDIENIRKMLTQQKRSRGIPCLIVANKKDLAKNERRVQSREGKQLADSINGTFCEISVSESYRELENVVNKFIKENCGSSHNSSCPSSQQVSHNKQHLMPQSRMLSSRSTPEIRKPASVVGGVENGVENEGKAEKKTRALWQKLLTNNDIKKKK